MLRKHTIDVIQMNEQESRDLGDYLTTFAPAVLKANSLFRHANYEFKLTQTLLADDKIKGYVVIDKSKSGILGFGSFSKVRNMLGYIRIDTELGIEHPLAKFESVNGKAIRIKNIKYAQKKNLLAKVVYNHDDAVKEHRNSLPFEHLGMQEPISVRRYSLELGIFDKSYSVLNKLPGTNLDDEMIDFYNNMISNTSTIVDNVLLPILEAYKNQIADKQYVHRDIKFENIRADIGCKYSTIHFLDVDSAKKIDEQDSAYGTPGFLAPELFDNPKPPVAQARDIFALGVLLMGCINPNLNPCVYINEALQGSANMQPVEFAIQELLVNKCYDPSLMKNSNGKTYDLFEYITEEGEIPEQSRKELEELLKQMTNLVPNERPSLDEAISKMKRISAALHHNNKPTASQFK